MKEFSQRLKHLRKTNQVTQSELSSVLGYGASTISNYENTDHEPDFKSLIAIARFFGVTLDYLLAVSDEPSPLSAEEYKLIRFYRALDEGNKAKLMNIVGRNAT